MTRRLLPVALVALSLLSACSILPKSEPLDIYLLPSQTLPLKAAPSMDGVSLRINKAQANQLLDSTRIAVVNQQNQISAYKGARWSDRAPLLLRDRLIEAFSQDAKLAAVSSDSNNLQADLELVMDLRAFQSEYRDGQVQAHVLLDVQLVEGDTQRILSSQRFNVRQAATSSAVPAVVQSLGLATDELSRQLVNWTQQQAHLRSH
ncbi:ABC-type transport auxiliary lipoprotein family protein [Pseudomonas sp. 5P_3.1_Bac2]|uniref:ABC-type transport auxiliary lipoprotein family protein n=1 Tax=Pseudomonas sp. 5P_3.1_Bac2 TaxID=2971617 RepID=UPI0021C8178E|nr:ABC-type transport auxiliary lipoprotein family protein [Pseudomonas sp. 5P_3.1_Bac2]MCU1718534.1 ABC-type transport auxiliary lipoprotein family protein [Pseudomonas sp. 5P_3.1_Bac2]